MANNTYVNKVQYQGSTLIDISDTTATAGTVLSGYRFYGADGSPVTGTYVPAGGEIKWMGDSPEFVSTVWTNSKSLESIPGNEYSAWWEWTASTSNKIFEAGDTVATASVDFDSYDYWIEQIVDVTVKLKQTATKKIVPQRQFGKYYYCIYRRASNKANVEAGTGNSNVVSGRDTNNAVIYYYNSSGSTAVVTGTNGYTYGIACAAVAPALVSTTAASTTLNIKNPDIHARCSTTYFATARKTDVDSTDTVIKRKINLYRVTAGTSPISVMDRNSYSMWNSPLT